MNEVDNFIDGKYRKYQPYTDDYKDNDGNDKKYIYNENDYIEADIRTVALCNDGCCMTCFPFTCCFEQTSKNPCINTSLFIYMCDDDVNVNDCIICAWKTRGNDIKSCRFLCCINCEGYVKIINDPNNKNEIVHEVGEDVIGMDRLLFQYMLKKDENKLITPITAYDMYNCCGSMCYGDKNNRYIRESKYAKEHYNKMYKKFMVNKEQDEKKFEEYKKYFNEYKEYSEFLKNKKSDDISDDVLDEKSMDYIQHKIRKEYLDRYNHQEEGCPNS